MASSVDLTPAASKAVVPYFPQPSQLERTSDFVARRSLKAAQFELSHLRPVSEKQMRAIPRRLSHVLPPLSGPFRVGYAKMKLVNPVNGSEVGIEIYAPAKGRGQKALLELPAGHPLRSELHPDQIASLQTHATEGIGPKDGKPTLIFSHGWGQDAAQYRPLLEEAASRGYTVVALTHPSSAKPYSGPPEKEAEAASILRIAQVQNIRYVVEQIRDGSVNGIAGDRIVLAGHSMGGVASIEAARGDGQIAGCINIDGGLDSHTPGLETPVLTVLADHLHAVDWNNSEDKKWAEEVYLPVMVKNWTDFDADSAEGSRLMRISGIGHEDFTMSPLLNWVAGDSTAQKGLKAHQETSADVLNFLEQRSLDF